MMYRCTLRFVANKQVAAFNISGVYGCTHLQGQLRKIGVSRMTLQEGTPLYTYTPFCNVLIDLIGIKN